MLRLINIGLLLSFLICYLQWGRDQSGFLFQMEYEIFTPKKNLTDSFKHPFIFIPFIGQLLLLYNSIAPKPGRKLTLAGMLLLAVLVLMILLVGILAKNPKIILSTAPFILLSIFFFIRKTHQL